MKTYGTSWQLYISAFTALALAAAGCGLLPDRGLSGPASRLVSAGLNAPPQTRFGGYAAAIPMMRFLGDDLGSHSYHWPFFEKNGVAYTCQGGHIDVVHLRNSADWTAYLAAESYKHLMKKDAKFSCRTSVDRSLAHIRISYPPGWNCLSKDDRSAIAEKMAMSLGPYLAFTLVTWHEITTWYGYKSMLIPVEYDSAFSWEDSYSNLLGINVAMRALQDKEHSYNKAVTLAIDEQMQELGVLPTAREARQISKSMKGVWYSGIFVLFFDMKKRNFDIGVDDGCITPTLVPGVSECPDAEPRSYPVPSLDVLAEYGFSVKVEIEPREWEKKKILRVALGNEHGKRIDPETHLAIIMDHIQREAAAKYGPEYDPDNQQHEHHYVRTAQ